MKRKFKDMEKIEKYLDNQVDEQERVEVNNRLVSDEEFRRLFDEMESLLEGINHTGAKTTVEEKLQNLEESIHKLDEEEGEEEVQEKPIIIVWYNRPVYRAIAASIVLLIVAVYAFGPFGTMSDERLFAEHFSAYINVDGPTRSDVTDIDQKKRAYAFYDMKDYEGAIPVFVDMIKGSQNQIMDKFYLANAYLALGKGEEAKRLFQEVVNKKIGLASPAKWYLALSYLQTGDRENAQREFREIVEAESDYAEDAKEVLGRMRK
jgi:tetratricopeptide (TPR) repeat protein